MSSLHPVEYSAEATSCQLQWEKATYV